MSRRTILLLSALAFVALALTAWGDGAAAARAWLCAFILVSTVPIGGLGLLLVHSISGGRWGNEFAPALAPAARTIPLLLLLFLPVIAFRPLIYDWSALQLPHGVRAWYLNGPFFDLRTLIGLAIWSVLAWIEAWRRPLLGPLGLVAHIVLVSLLLPDWVLTIQPGAISAGFGLGFGIEQMFAAIAFTAILAPQSPGRPNRDLTGIMVSTLLGTVYFLYVQFLITWYGNIPQKVHWYEIRSRNGWETVGLFAFLLGAALPFLATLHAWVRREPRAMRWVACLVLVGIALHVGWMTLPGLGASAIWPAVFAAIGVALLAWFAGTFLQRWSNAVGR